MLKVRTIKMRPKRPIINLRLEIKYRQDFSHALSKDARNVIDAWGLSLSKDRSIIQNLSIPFDWNSIYYFFGYSGSGKSSILNSIFEQLGSSQDRTVYYISNYKNYINEIDQTKLLIDYFPDIHFKVRLKVLGLCGLLEAWKFVSEVKDLSDGEKFRFVLYDLVMTILQEKKNAIIIFDEFCSTLDRITAHAVATNIRNLREILNKEGIDVTFVLASAHDDLANYMQADFNYFKEFQPTLTNVKPNVMAAD